MKKKGILSCILNTLRKIFLTPRLVYFGSYRQSFKQIIIRIFKRLINDYIITKVTEDSIPKNEVIKDLTNVIISPSFNKFYKDQFKPSIMAQESLLFKIIKECVEFYAKNEKLALYYNSGWKVNFYSLIRPFTRIPFQSNHKEYDLADYSGIFTVLYECIYHFGFDDKKECPFLSIGNRQRIDELKDITCLSTKIGNRFDVFSIILFEPIIYVVMDKNDVIEDIRPMFRIVNTHDPHTDTIIHPIDNLYYRFIESVKKNKNLRISSTIEDCLTEYNYYNDDNLLLIPIHTVNC